MSEVARQENTTEKPIFAKPAAAPNPAGSSPSKENCVRCRQVFFCSDHDLSARELNTKASNVAVGAPSSTDVLESKPPKEKKVVDINQPQTCRNTFKEEDNHETACNYHHGPAIFHDRIREWKCYDIHVKELDELMSIPPCTKGWHNADPV